MSRKPIRPLAAILLLAAASPALAQSGPPPSRTERTAQEIARQIEEAARAIGTVRDSVDRGVDDLRYRGEERMAINRCGPAVERYGRMRVDRVAPYRRGGWRVYGTVDAGPRYRGGYSSRGYGLRVFTCTIRHDGRVKVKTSRIRRY